MNDPMMIRYGMVNYKVISACQEKKKKAWNETKLKFAAVHLDVIWFNDFCNFIV